MTLREEPAGLEYLHVPTLSAFALAQPLFDITARHAQFYVARGSQPLDVVLLTLGLGFALPLLLGLVEPILGWIRPSAGLGCRRLLIAALVALISMPVLLELKASTPLLITLASIPAIGVAWAYGRAPKLRWFLSLITPALLVFPIFFLIRTPIQQILFPRTDFPRPQVAVANPVPVVLMVLDELPLSGLLDQDLEIDAGAFPHFAALADTAYWFRNASTVSGDTTIAVPAILTGRYPAVDDRRPASSASHPENLFTLLGTAMDLNVSETITRLCPPEYQNRFAAEADFGQRNRRLYRDLLTVFLHLVTPPRWAARLPRIDVTWSDFEEPRYGDAGEDRARREDQLRRFADRIVEHPAGVHFLHLLLPHPPWEYLPSGHSYNDRWLMPGWEHPTLKQNIWDQDLRAVQLAYQRFLVQLRNTDRLFGELRSRLEEADVWDRALVIVVADHGVVFSPEKHRRGLEPEDFERDVMPVPLLVKLPHQRSGVVSSRNVETIDIVPTIAEVLGVEPPWPLDGQSLISSGSERPSKSYFAYLIPEYQPHHAPRELTAMAETVRWKRENFDPGDPAGDGMFHHGPHRDLVGRSVNGLDLEPRSSIRAVLLRSHLYQGVDRDRGFVPAYILGEIHADAEPARPFELAVAVGGRVHATTRTYRQPNGVLRFAALVAEDAFQDGPNDVQILEIRGHGAGRTLAPTDTLGHEEHRQQQFDGLLEADGAWSFVVPLEQVRPLQQVELGITRDGRIPVLEVESQGIDPALELPFPRPTGTDYLVVRLEITAPAATELRLFYLAEGETSFLHNSQRLALKAGRNTVLLELRDDDIRGPLRLDPGMRAGRYRIRGLELRGRS